jgi:DNA-directed RNA polymerase specialized sigma24 family protein
MDNGEIAARLGITVETVRQRLSRAIRTLQERW